MVGFHIKLIYFCFDDFQVGTCSKQQSDRSVGEGVRWQWQSRGTRLCCFSNKRRNSTPPNKSFRLNNIFGARNESTASRSLLFFVFQSEENCSVVSNLKEVMNVFCQEAFWFGSIFDNLSSYIKGTQRVLKELCLEDIVVFGQFCAEFSTSALILHRKCSTRDI